MLALGAAIAAAAMQLIPSDARAEDDVRLRLNWMYYGSHAGFALGKDKGYYKEHGINLDIRSGNGSGSAHRLVANGDSTFSYGSCASMTNLAAQGAPLISVAVIDAMGTEAIIVRPDAGVKAIGDLKGKALLTTANAGVNTFFPMVLEECRPCGGRRHHHQRAGWRAGLVLSAEARAAPSASSAAWTTSRRRSRPTAAPIRSRFRIRTTG